MRPLPLHVQRTMARKRATARVLLWCYIGVIAAVLCWFLLWGQA